MQSESLPSDLAQSLLLKNEVNIPKRRRRFKKKKKNLVITPLSSQELSLSEEMTTKTSDADTSLNVTDERDYKDSDFLEEEAEELPCFEFKTPREILMERRFTESYFTGTPIDELFDDNRIKSGSIIEICGRHQIGKTTLVTSLALDVLTEFPQAHVAFIDTKNDIQATQLRQYLLLRGHDEETIQKDFFSRILLFNALNLFQFVDTLKTIIKGEGDYRKISFIFVDSITSPFYHTTSASIRLNMKMTSEIHELLFQLAKKMNKVVILTNLQLNMYKISESDESESDSDSSSSTSSSEHESAAEINLKNGIKPALGNYWGEILDLRISMGHISMDGDREIDICSGGFVEIKRKLTVLESSKMLPTKSVLVNFTDTGVI